LNGKGSCKILGSISPTCFCAALPEQMLLLSSYISPTILCPTSPGVNFTIVLHKAFCAYIPKAQKRLTA